jgi:hypothetical protein
MLGIILRKTGRNKPIKILLLISSILILMGIGLKVLFT